MPAAKKTDQRMDLWNALKSVDRKFTKKITGKSYQGDSPNPTYIIQKLTEVMGPIGDQWGFTVVGQGVNEGLPHQIVKSRRAVFHPEKFDANGAPMQIERVEEYEIIRELNHWVHIRFWFRPDDDDGYGSRHFDAFGGTPQLYKTSKGKWVHDEDAAKKSLTDAYVKGASWLGVCADLFLGLFDDRYENPGVEMVGSDGDGFS